MTNITINVINHVRNIKRRINITIERNMEIVNVMRNIRIVINTIIMISIRNVIDIMRTNIRIGTDIMRRNVQIIVNIMRKNIKIVIDITMTRNVRVAVTTSIMMINIIPIGINTMIARNTRNVDRTERNTMVSVAEKEATIIIISNSSSRSSSSSTIIIIPCLNPRIVNIRAQVEISLRLIVVLIVIVMPLPPRQGDVITTDAKKISILILLR